MVQTARQPSVLFQIAGAVVGAARSDNTGAVYGPRGSVQQPRSLRIQHRQVLSSVQLLYFPLSRSSFSLMHRCSRSVRGNVKKHREKNVAVFDGGLFQQLGANTAEERDSWLQALQLASYECMRSQLLSLRQRIEAFSGHKHDTDIQMLRLQRGTFTGVNNLKIRNFFFAWNARFYSHILQHVIIQAFFNFKLIPTEFHENWI